MAPTSFSCSGKTAVITGAGSGINLAFAELLLSRGCNVVLADLSLRPEAEEVVRRHSAADARPRAVFVRTDVTSWPALEAVYAAALREFGEYHIVCPGAGVYEPHWSNFWLPPGSAESRDKPDSGHYALLDINLNHPIRATQLALQHWIGLPGEAKVSPANPRRIVHISSVAAQFPVFRAPLYGASKYAISGFVRCLAELDGALGVRVTAVAPGVVRTPLWTDHPEKLSNVDDADGWVTPEEVALEMLRCCEEEGMPGGSVVEVGRAQTRLVDWRNDPGPSTDPRDGCATRNNDFGDNMVWGWLKDPNIWGGSGAGA